MPGPEKTLSVAVFGAAGYVGGELLRLLLAHPSVLELRAFSESRAGEALGERVGATSQQILGLGLGSGVGISDGPSLCQSARIRFAE